MTRLPCYVNNEGAHIHRGGCGCCISRQDADQVVLGLVGQHLVALRNERDVLRHRIDVAQGALDNLDLGPGVTKVLRDLLSGEVSS